MIDPLRRPAVSWVPTLSTLLLGLLLAWPATAFAEDPPTDLPSSGDSEEVPDLPVFEAPHDPVRELVGQAANPYAPEEAGQVYFDRLVALGTPAVPTLVSIYRDPKSSDLESWVSARAMGRIGGQQSTETLSWGLGSPRIITRLGGASGLRLSKDPRGVDALEKALFDKAMTVRATAADALGAIGARSSHTALIEALNLPSNFHNGQSLFVRRHIVEALGLVGSIGSINTLIGTIEDPDEEVRTASVQSLGQITGISFREMMATADSPPTNTEIESWKQWWSQRQTPKLDQQ